MITDAADTTFVRSAQPVADAFQVPALCKVGKGRRTHYVLGASEVKSLGHPPRVRECAGQPAGASEKSAFRVPTSPVLP